MRGVAENGKVRFVDVPRRAHVRVLADAILKNLDGMKLTKTEIVKNFSVARALATAAIHELDGRGAVRWDPVSPGAKWAEPSFTVWAPKPAVRTGPAETPAEAARRRKMEDLYRKHGRGTCVRCGGPMPGKSQIGKHKRGHPQRVCDVQLVRIIQEG
jgi:hypothetical protein